MRCDLHCPPAASVLRGPLLAVAALAAVSLAVYVVSLLGGVLVTLLAAVLAADCAGIALFVRRYARLPQRRIRVTLQDSRLGAELVAGEPGRLPAPLAIEPARAVPAVVVLGSAEKVEQWAGQ